ncbi:hypothetical protein LCGC14_1866250, partial [marine sediment metagenome]
MIRQLLGWVVAAFLAVFSAYSRNRVE